MFGLPPDSAHLAKGRIGRCAVGGGTRLVSAPISYLPLESGVSQGPGWVDAVRKTRFSEMLAKPSKKRPSQSLCIGRSSSREYQTDPEKQAENSVFEFFNRIGRLHSVTKAASGKRNTNGSFTAMNSGRGSSRPDPEESFAY